MERGAREELSRGTGVGHSWPHGGVGLWLCFEKKKKKSGKECNKLFGFEKLGISAAASQGQELHPEESWARPSVG